MKYRTTRVLVLPALLLSVLLGACKSTAQLPPIEQLDQPPGIRLNYCTVSRDDSLYSIAWRYGVDFRELAQRNHIPPPYTIRTGQKIMLGEDSGHGARTSAASPRSIPVPPGVQVKAIPQDDHPVTEVASTNSRVAPSVPPASTGSKAVEPEEPPPTAAVVPTNPASVAAASGGGRWLWPTSGRIVTQYSATDPLRKGIDLEGKLGDPVRATGAGTVVYAGSGLAGYGQLVIIKHDEQFLSAYGHNSKLLVAEGDTVKSGQTIAEVGSSGTDSNKLHFEIRQAGKPVDPLLYLPRR